LLQRVVKSGGKMSEGVRIDDTIWVQEQQMFTTGARNTQIACLAESEVADWCDPFSGREQSLKLIPPCWLGTIVNDDNLRGRRGILKRFETGAKKNFAEVIDDNDC
jgi:hypothetical protein